MAAKLSRRSVAHFLSRQIGMLTCLFVAATITLIPALAAEVKQPTKSKAPALTRGIEFGVTDGQGKQVVLYKESHALVIGISNYTNGWPKLPGVQQDVQEVKRVLEAQGFNVVVKTNLDRNALEQAFNEFIRQYGQKPENRLLFYFAGHGHTLQATYGEEMGYIVPADAPSPTQDEEGFRANALDMQMIEVYAKRIQAKHALFVFDSCFSGSLFALSRAIPDAIGYKTSQPVRQFITSGSANETVPDKSLFRSQFARALQGEADSNQDGYVTGSELGEFLQTSVVNYSKAAQHPQYGKIRNPNLDKGDFVFELPAPSTSLRVTPTPEVNPPKMAFSLGNLEDLAAMEEAFAQVTAYEQRNISTDLKIAAWQQFLQAFADDLPSATRDDELRNQAQERLRYWQEQKVVVTPTPTPKPLTAPIIILAAAIPAEVEQDTFELHAIVEDEAGIQAVEVNKAGIGKDGKRGLSVAVPPEKKPQGQKKYEFRRSIPLEPGTNDVTIVATDVNGQETRQMFRIFRKIPPQQREGDVWAVIIGIGQYQDRRLNLRFTENDAQGLYDVLTNPDVGGFPKDHVKLLLNEYATAKNIKSAIGTWLTRQAGPNDTVIIYYAGHGAPEGQETYWVTYDADINDLYSSALNNNDVSDMLSRIKAKRLLTFLDACYSAATVNRTNSTRGTPIEIPWDKFTGAGRVTIAASNGKQQSLEDEQLKHGVFTYRLIEGLQGKADGQGGQARDGVVDLDEMWNYVKDRVKEDARKRGNDQEPRLITQEGISSGILLSYDAAFFRQQDQQQKTMAQEQSQDVKKKQAKLQKLYDQDQLPAELLDCALKMIDAGTSNKYLEDLLADKMSPETFARLFKCSAPK